MIRRAGLRQCLPLLLASVIVAACFVGQRPTGQASGSPAASVVMIAQDLSFVPSSVRLPSGVALGITLNNRDPGILHNITIDSERGDVVFRGETFAGIEERTYVVAPLTAGGYRLLCDVHPTMTGTITVDP